MLKRTRPDGTYIQGLPHFTRLVPYLMPRRSDATIFFEQEFDVTRTLEYVHAANAARGEGVPKLTFFQVFLCATTRTIALRPKLNRFVSGFNFYQRNSISFNFVAKRTLEDEGAEMNITMAFSPYETLSTLPARVAERVNRYRGGENSDGDDLNALVARLPRPLIKAFIGFVHFLDYHNMLPGPVIKSLPFYSTVFFTNVGSVGIDAPFHHHFETGTCGLFIAIGKIRDEGGRKKVKVTFTFDDRIVDGIYCGRGIDLLRGFVEEPSALENPPEIPPATLAELALKD